MQRSGEQAPRANDLSPDELQVVPSEWPVCEVTRKVCGARLLTRCLGGATLTSTFLATNATARRGFPTNRGVFMADLFGAPTTRRSRTQMTVQTTRPPTPRIKALNHEKTHRTHGCRNACIDS